MEGKIEKIKKLVEGDFSPGLHGEGHFWVFQGNGWREVSYFEELRDLYTLQLVDVTEGGDDGVYSFQEWAEKQNTPLKGIFCIEKRNFHQVEYPYSPPKRIFKAHIYKILPKD